MQTARKTATHTIAPVECGAIFVSLELSRSFWLVTALATPVGSKMSRHQVRGGDMSGLLERFSDLQRNVQRRTGQVVPVIVIQEAGLDGFWIHRALATEGIESHVVDPASIAVSRRHRRAKTDRIDGEALVRTLMAWRRGEPRVCSMVCVPTPGEEDRRRVCRELKTLIGERIRHVNRLKGLFFAQGIDGYEPRNKDRRERLEDLRTGDGRALPKHLKALALRELEIIELLNQQIEAVKAERNALLEKAPVSGSAPEPVRMLLELKGIGAGFAGALWSEGLFRNSRTGDRSQRMPVLRLHHGRVARSTTNRVSRRRAIPVCAPSPWKWPGFGCAINPTRHLRDGITRGFAGSARAPGKSRSSP